MKKLSKTTLKRLVIKAEELAKLVIDLEPHYDVLSRRAIRFVHLVEREKQMAAKKTMPKPHTRLIT